MNVWYSYDPEDGYSTHTSAEEARDGAEASLEYHRDRSTDGWHESTSDIEWGLLVPFGEARECQRRETPDGDFDYICDYQLVSAPCDDPLEQAYRRLEQSTDWHQQRYNAVRAWVESEVRPLSETVAQRYYSVVANGAPCPYQPADWSSTVHGLTLRAKQAEKERDEAVEALESLEAAILEALPYRYDDGTDEEADPGECIGYAAKELAELRKEVTAASALESVIATSASVEAQLRQERDKARADYQFMVDRAINEKLDGYRELGARAAAAQNERDELRRWQYEVADGVGYVNTCEGQGGYEVADAETIVQAFKQMERRGDVLLSLLKAAREVLLSQHDPEDCLHILRSIDEAVGE